MMTLANNPGPQHPDRMVSVSELADYLQLTEETVRRLARDGRVPSVKVARRVRFDLRDVLRALQGDEE